MNTTPLEDEFGVELDRLLFEHTDYYEDEDEHTVWAFELEDLPKLFAAHTQAVQKAVEEARIIVVTSEDGDTQTFVLRPGEPLIVKEDVRVTQIAALTNEAGGQK